MIWKFKILTPKMSASRMYTENFRVPPPPLPGLQPSLQKLQVFFAVGGGRGANSWGGVSLSLSPDFPFLMSSVHFFSS